MINLSLDQLRLIAEIRNISDYEKKPKEGLIKAHSEPKPEAQPKQTSKPEQTPKPETKPKQITKPEPEPKLEIKVNKKKLKKILKGFEELRHKFSKREIQSIEKLLMLLKIQKSCYIRNKEVKQKS